MHVKHTPPVDPAKEAAKVQQAKIDPNKPHLEPSKIDPSKESARLSESAREFNKGLTHASHTAQSTEAVNHERKVEAAKETVNAATLRREMEKTVRA